MAFSSLCNKTRENQTQSIQCTYHTLTRAPPSQIFLYYQLSSKLRANVRQPNSQSYFLKSCKQSTYLARSIPIHISNLILLLPLSGVQLVFSNVLSSKRNFSLGCQIQLEPRFRRDSLNPKFQMLQNFPSF